MKEFVLSIKIVFLFIIQEKKFNSFLTKIDLFNEPNLLKTKLKNISSLIIAFFPMTFIFIYDKSGFVEQALRTLNINSHWITYFITVIIVLITVFMMIVIVLIIYVLNFILKHKNN